MPGNQVLGSSVRTLEQRASGQVFLCSWTGRSIVLAVGTVALFILLIRTGWASEDSYISFRVVDNFLHGFGLTWNTGERVQVYTDPLFVFLVAAATWITGNVYWASVVVSLLLTMAAYFLLMSRQTIAGILVGTAVLLSSKAFMDFSVSGMENPATHLGIAAFCLVYWRKPSPFLLTLIATLTAVNRLDSILLFLPALLFVYWQTGWKVWKSVLLGSMPLLAWEVFSVLYYGFPFPNTAYAKLGAGISFLDSLQGGLWYLENSFKWDIVTPLIVITALGIGFWKREWPLTIGLLISIAYVVRIGGDFMSGRFLSAPLFLACAIVVRHLRLSWKPALGLSTAILLATLVNPSPTLATTAELGVVSSENSVFHGIADERAFFYSATGLLRWRRGLRWPDNSWSDQGDQLRKSGPQVAIINMAGVVPYHAGPGVYVIDQGALGNALLARLPPMLTARRPGHYFRDLPSGYFNTVAARTNQLHDPGLAEYYTHLHRIISGDLFRIWRFQDIVAINLGKYDYLLPKTALPATTPTPTVAAATTSTPR
jgi:arabinofuranosyltransferase